MPLNFAWPWLERRSVTAGRRSLNSHLSRALCSHPAMILLRSACRICQLSFGPYCHPVASTSAVLYTWTWQPIQPAACRLIQLAQPQIPQSPLLFWSSQEHADDHDWVPIFMYAYFCMGAYICKDSVRTEMGAYIHGCLNSRGAYYTE